MSIWRHTGYVYKYTFAADLLIHKSSGYGWWTLAQMQYNNCHVADDAYNEIYP